MSRAQKEQEIKDLNARFEDSEVVIVTHYSGLDMPAVTKLRSELRDNGASFKVTKNTLTKLAIKGTRYEQLEGHFTGPTGVATSQDPVAAAKVVANFAKENDKLKILGGAMGDVILDEAAVKQLASLPSLDELRSKIVGLLVAPATQVARVLQAPAQQMVGVTKAYSEKG
ncbi:MAG: 50S ribosomal protein L10 [Pseudomonadota bacterium]